ncbi:MAG: protein-L-isoaspartate(D-aspartate) O-methyltransferase [Leptospirales bacterium]
MISEDPFLHARERMVATIERHAQGSASYTGFRKFSKQVLDAMGKVPREQFVPGDSRKYAYEDRAMSIGSGQTISQPYVVALMVEALQINNQSNVLEIGSGCGYHAAVLSKIAKTVFSIDIVPELVEVAKKNLENYENVTVSCRNGRFGWAEHAPYDAISIPSASTDIPKILIEHLKPDGKMILPIGAPGKTQTLTVVTKLKNGDTESKGILPVVFVPFVESR